MGIGEIRLEELVGNACFFRRGTLAQVVDGRNRTKGGLHAPALGRSQRFFPVRTGG